MSYHFKRDESVPEAVRRIALEELESVADQLGRPRNRNHDDAIHESHKRVKTWRIRTAGFAAIERGFQKTFRAGRTAFALAQKRPRPENYHEWRKRLKDHWYHIRLLENVWTDVLLGYENSLKVLETWLG